MSADPETLDSFLRSTGTEWGSSRWDAVATCEVKAAIRYEPTRYRLPVIKMPDPISPREAEADSREIALQVGSLWHAMIAWLADGEQCDEPREWREILERAGEQGDRWDPKAIAEARRIMPAYISQWGGTWSPNFRVEAVELPLRVDVGPLPWTTQADLVLEDLDGLIWFVDHKSRGATPSRDDPEGAIKREARVRPQFLGTSTALREHFQLFYNPGVIVNVAVKTKVPAFFRVPVMLRDHELAMWRTAQEAFAARREAGIEPIPNLRECASHPYGPCEFYEVCHGSED